MAISLAPQAAPTRPFAQLGDNELVALTRAGDDAAFEALYARYHRRIAAYVHGMVGDFGRAEDIAQDVFISALRRMRETDRPIAFKPWIYEIAKNACIDQFRRSRRAEEVSIDADAGLAPADQGKLASRGPSPEAAVEGKQRLDDLRGAFGGLSDVHHEILVLREFEGLSYREIGERLGMSRPAVESTLFRARRRLSEEFEELASGERCRKVQAIVATAGSSALGIRDRRRLAGHVDHCHACRRHAMLAGIDCTRRPLRTRVAAFLPLPVWLRERLGVREADAPAALAAQSTAVAHATSAVAGYVEPGLAGWAKAATAAAAIAVAGVGGSQAIGPVSSPAEVRRAPVAAEREQPRAAAPAKAPTQRAAATAAARAALAPAATSRPTVLRRPAGRPQAGTTPAAPAGPVASGGGPAAQPGPGAPVVAPAAPKTDRVPPVPGGTSQPAGAAPAAKAKERLDQAVAPLSGALAGGAVTAPTAAPDIPQVVDRVAEQVEQVTQQVGAALGTGG